MLRGRMLRDVKSIKREALKPGVPELKCVFVCSKLSQAPASRKRWTIDAAGEDILVEIPEGGSLDAWTIKQVIGLAVRVEIGRSYQSIAACNHRRICAANQSRAGQVPDRRLARACIAKEIIGLAVAVEVRNTNYSPIGWKRWSKSATRKHIVV